MTMTATKTTFNGKEIKIGMAQGFHALYGSPLESAMYVTIALQVAKKYPVDMLIFEMKGKVMQIRLAGYDFNTNELDETTIAGSFKSIPTETFWFKVDDYGDHYVGTFLLPSDY